MPLFGTRSLPKYRHDSEFVSFQKHLIAENVTNMHINVRYLTLDK